MTLSKLFFLFSAMRYVLAAWLFSRVLPMRSHGRARLCLTVAFVLVAAWFAYDWGFSLFPPLSDDASFVRAIADFLGGALLVSILLQRVIWDCPAYTSIFCCSMAYALENLSAATERSLSMLQGTNATAQGLFATTPLTYAVNGCVRYWGLTSIVYAIVYLLLVRRLEKPILVRIDNYRALLVAVLSITVNIILDLVIKDLNVLDIPNRYRMALNLIYIFLCAFIMYSEYEIIYAQKLKADVAVIEQLRASEAKRYRMTKETVDAINARVHDIRHQLFRTLAQTDMPIDRQTAAQLAHDVDVYDSAIYTGNETLDALLTEKRLLCDRKGIRLSCIIDGSTLRFMRPVDLFALFGNALDNAMGAVEALGDPELASISLIVRQRGQMVTIHLENYFGGDVHLDDNGLPLAKDGQGYGLGTRAMLTALEPYDGTLTASIRGDVFHLDAIVPIPE